MIDDLRQLRHIAALGGHATLSEAAESLGITKSALSQSIQRIEDVYGVPLFVRGRRGIQITTYGEMLVSSARRSIEIFSHTRRQIDLVKNLEIGRLIIGCDPVISEVLLSRVLARMLKSYPMLRYVVKSGFWIEHEAAVESGEIDFFIGIRPDRATTEFDVTEITLPGIAVYCRYGHPLTERDDIVLENIYEYPILGPSMPEWFYREIDNYFDEQGRDNRHIHDLFLLTNDEGTMRAIVSQSDAVSGGFRALIQTDLDMRRLAVLPLRRPPFYMPIPCIVASCRGRPLPPAALKVIEAIKDVAGEIMRLDDQMNQ